MFPRKLFPFSRYKISGHSMEPTLREGQVIWVNNLAYLFSRPKTGDVIVFKLNDKEIIKRIDSLVDGSVKVKGDNPADSLTFPEVMFNQVLGKVLI